MIDLAGKVAIITGAASGIGAASAQLLASLGAAVAVTDIDEDGAGRVSASICQQGGRAEPFRCDVSDPADVRQAVEGAAATLGGPDILVANAGGSFGVPPTTAIDDVRDEDFDLIVRRNLNGAFYCARAVAPAMRARGWGRIVIVSSGAGRATSRTYTGRLQYASAKAAQLGFTRQLAVEMAPYGVTVNAVAPGLIRTSERLERAWEAQSDDARQRFLDSVPMGRRGEAHEVAAAIAFLASPAASYITGHCVDVNGGRHMH